MAHLRILLALGVLCYATLSSARAEASVVSMKLNRANELINLFERTKDPLDLEAAVDTLFVTRSPKDQGLLHRDEIVRSFLRIFVICEKLSESTVKPEPEQRNILLPDNTAQSKEEYK